VETAFGHHITDSDEVEERIRRAQLAILNPSKRATDFLGTLGSTNGGLTNELSFSSDLISVRISGVEVDDLSFVDLPGPPFLYYLTFELTLMIKQGSSRP
jgi:hypothetical protein